MSRRDVSPLGQILMDAARDMNKRYLAGESLAPVESETAARIAAHFQKGDDTGPLTAEERMQQDKTPEVERYCASCSKPLEPGQHKWCSRQCVEADDGPYDDEQEEDQ